MWFIELMKYKETKNKEEHPVISYLYRKKYSENPSCFQRTLPFLMVVFAFALMIIDTFITFPR
jgi:hypothetical protein